MLWTTSSHSYEGLAPWQVRLSPPLPPVTPVRNGTTWLCECWKVRGGPNKVESEIMSGYVQQSVRSGRCLIQEARLRSDMGSVKPARRRDSPHIYDDLAWAEGRLDRIEETLRGISFMILGNSLDCMVIVQYPDLQLTQLKALPKIPKIPKIKYSCETCCENKCILVTKFINL